MGRLAEFADIIKYNEPLAPYTQLKLGGPAEMVVHPRSREEAAAVVQRCTQDQIPLRVLGGGCNVLVHDEGVRGAVVRLVAPPFTEIAVEGQRVRVGAGALLSALISEAARHSLAGLETLVGIQGTVGGAVVGNAGDRSGEIGPYVRRVEIIDERGLFQFRERDELRFAYRWSNLDDPVIISAEFELEQDRADSIVKRMRKAWIQRKAAQPLSFQAAARLFKNPRGFSASALVEQAGLRGTKVGGVELSDRDANYVVAHQGAHTRDVLRLVDLIRSRVRERFGVELELEPAVWQ
jgi:UDP-N-acetylmuramate dehydrogenase